MGRATGRRLMSAFRGCCGRGRLGARRGGGCAGAPLRVRAAFRNGHARATCLWPGVQANRFAGKAAPRYRGRVRLHRCSHERRSLIVLLHPLLYSHQDHAIDFHVAAKVAGMTPRNTLLVDLGLALLLVSTNFEVLATLDGLLGDTLANLALELKYNLLCSLGLYSRRKTQTPQLMSCGYVTERIPSASPCPHPRLLKTACSCIRIDESDTFLASTALSDHRSHSVCGRNASSPALGLPRLWNVNLSTSGRHISLANAYCYCPLARPSRADPWPLMALYVYYARRLFATHHETRVALAIARFNFKRMDSAPQQQPRGAIRVRYTFRW
eukprot:scaffold1201_cov413-Prasinococcus_capsulatus_cf.AAC.8